MAEKETKTLKRVCKCEHCGNEAEMVVTCTLVDEADSASAEAKTDAGKGSRRVRGTGTCSHCGNEADMWLDI
ncbi:hypothetical protein B2D07_17590 [Desulfococcus multivorans]|jgi:hypothetical protein|nr:conserved uncharacterized protein [Desulfococcus multivorans]AQV03119.1 hypothetical protein B2D07_17590 [Desulfococcus multivorans]